LIGIRKLAAQKDIREKELIAILEAFVTHISTPEKKLQVLYLVSCRSSTRGS